MGILGTLAAAVNVLQAVNVALDVIPDLVKKAEEASPEGGGPFKFQRVKRIAGAFFKAAMQLAPGHVTPEHEAVGMALLDEAIEAEVELNNAIGAFRHQKKSPMVDHLGQTAQSVQQGLVAAAAGSPR